VVNPVATQTILVAYGATLDQHGPARVVRGGGLQAMLLYILLVIAYCALLDYFAGAVLRRRAQERLRGLRARLRANLKRRGKLHV
jgi:hypothetical protein